MSSTARGPTPRSSFRSASVKRAEGSVSWCISARAMSFPEISKYVFQHSGSASAAVPLGCRVRPPSFEQKSPNFRSVSAAVASRKNSLRCPSPLPVSASPWNFTCSPFRSRAESRRPSHRHLKSSLRLTVRTAVLPGVLCLLIRSETQVRLYSRVRLSTRPGCHCINGTSASTISFPCRWRLRMEISLEDPCPVTNAPGPVASSSAWSMRQEGSQSSTSQADRSSQELFRTSAGFEPRRTTGLVSLLSRKHSRRPRTSLSSMVACSMPLSRPDTTRSAWACWRSNLQPFLDRRILHR
mmetsp:Transcript_8427/g.23784  ORF Transcript_8427/g.23784 Transcript_8427/m.23784 type:complete len:297 (-) Transcript_8427:1185-2075(-)